MNRLKYIIGRMGLFVVMVICFLTGNMKVNAEEMKMFYTTQQINVYEKQDISSKVLITVEEGIPILLLEEGDTWCQVQYKGETGYVETVFLQRENEELALELDEQHEYNQVFMNEVLRLEEEKAQSRIWGSVIVILILGIFGVGIWNTVKANKKETEQSETTVKQPDEELSLPKQEKI